MYVALYIVSGTPVSEVFTCVYVGQYIGSVTAASEVFFMCQCGSIYWQCDTMYLYVFEHLLMLRSILAM